MHKRCMQCTLRYTSNACSAQAMHENARFRCTRAHILIAAFLLFSAHSSNEHACKRKGEGLTQATVCVCVWPEALQLSLGHLVYT